MTKLKRSECSVLQLVLKRKWYDMIASGEKKEEYRESKRHWWTRFSNWISGSILSKEDGVFRKRKPMVVAFSLGYRSPDMFFLVSETSCVDRVRSDGTAHPEWGEPGFPHYIIKLGERVELVE